VESNAIETKMKTGFRVIVKKIGNIGDKIDKNERTGKWLSCVNFAIGMASLVLAVVSLWVTLKQDQGFLCFDAYVVVV